MTPGIFVLAMFASFFGGVLCDRASFPLLALWSKDIERTMNNEASSPPAVQPMSEVAYDRSCSGEKQRVSDKEDEYDKELFCKAAGVDPSAIRGS